MIKKLRIELALASQKDEKVTRYRVLQAESDIEKELDLPYISNKNSFISNLDSVSVEKKKLLYVVENKISRMLDKTPDLFKKYTALWSYLYFTFTDDQESNIFSSPHITSPILFNPSDCISTYTLQLQMNQRNALPSHTTYVNMYKRVNPLVVAHDMALTRPNAPHSNRAVYPDKQKLVNSLFDYYEKSTAGSVTSAYADVNNPMPGINLISDYEMKRFIYLSEVNPLPY